LTVAQTITDIAEDAEGKATRSSKLVILVRRSILAGEMPPGEKISLDRLRDRYRVSLSPLREAIARLVPTGLVEIEDQRGFRVAPVSAANLREVALIRAALEPMALSASIGRADLNWESAVMGALHRLTRAQGDLARTGDRTQAIDTERDFHDALIANCAMPMLRDLCLRSFDLNARYTHLFAAPETDLTAACAAIAKAACAGDAAAAARHLATHIEGAAAALAPRVPA
jgi:DNA-binding GntR family transcriptional regulator